MAPDFVKLVGEFIETERNIYAQCPKCTRVSRLTELRIFYGKKPPKDLLDVLHIAEEDLQKAEEEFEEKKDKVIEKAIERSKVTYIGKTLEHLAPIVAAWGHQPRDCKFLGEPIDFISFDGLFENDEVAKVTFIETKTGQSQLSPREKSIKQAVKKHEVYFEEFKIPT